MIIITATYSDVSYDIDIDPQITVREFFAMYGITETMPNYCLYKIQPNESKVLLDAGETLIEAGVMNGDYLLIEKKAADTSISEIA